MNTMLSSTPLGTAVPPPRLRGTVAAALWQLLVDHGQARGLDLRAWCAPEPGGERQADVAAQGTALPRVSLARFLRLAQYVAHALQQPHLGLLLGQSVLPGTLGPYGYAVLSCNTARQSLERVQRYARLIVDVGETQLEHHADECMRTWRLGASAGRALAEQDARLLAELVMAAFVTLAHRVCHEPHLPLRWVSFRHAAPGDVQPYAEVFGCELRFGASAHAVAFDSAYLDQPLPEGHPQVRAAMDALCERLLRELNQPGEPPWLAPCRSAIVQALEYGVPDLPHVAQQLGLPAATLRSRLAEQGLSFRVLVDGLRHELAYSYLRDQTLGLAEVAYLLGFSEQSAFQRAFKRWSGLTPGQWRSAQAPSD